MEDEGCRLVVVRIDCQPPDGISALLKFLRPGRSQRRFAEPCRRLDHGQSLSGELGNHVEEPWTRDQPLASRRNELGREEFELLPVEDSALGRGWLAFGARQSRLCQWCVPIGARPGPDPSNRASHPHYTTWTDIGKATGRFPARPSERPPRHTPSGTGSSDWSKTEGV